MRNREVNLVSARSARQPELNTYSRGSSRNDYAKKRQSRERRKKILIGAGIGVGALLIAILAAVLGYYIYLNNALRTDSSGNVIDMSTIDAVTVERERPEDPFYMLLIGTDNREGYDSMLSDTLILTYVNPKDKSAALVSIPRDTRVYLEGYGYIKINAAYSYGNMEEGHTGPEYAIQAVTDLTGVEIAGYAEIDFEGFKGVVDALGGVEVDVPVDIIGDYDAGGIDIYAGPQTLNGESALVFVRARETLANGDYQRQTDQRIFLQALAKQILSADPPTIINTINQIAQMCSTNFDITEIAQIASSMRGMSEQDIHTYMVPGTGSISPADDLWYQFTDEAGLEELLTAIESGVYPDFQGEDLVGIYAESYLPTTGDEDAGAGVAGDPNVTTKDFTVDVRNGWGIQGAATAVSDKLALAGYKQGEIGNAISMVYDETLIVYKDDAATAAANDIATRLGFGRVIPSADRYDFDGDILVVVGADFEA
jgi:LCP family protein required for cell wall assembly